MSVQSVPCGFDYEFTLLYIQVVKLDISIESITMFLVENLKKLSTGCLRVGYFSGMFPICMQIRGWRNFFCVDKCIFCGKMNVVSKDTLLLQGKLL